jgi:dTDP-glucose pyrophosphorylase
MQPMDDSILGVILAAGKGSRMVRLPTDLPKCVLPVLNRPILAHQLDLLEALGVRQVFVVVGHRGFEVVREIERLPSHGLRIEYVEQHETLGIAHCVGTLESRLDRPFLLLLGDIFLRRPRLQEMVDSFRTHQADAVLCAVPEAADEALSRNFCIVPGEDGRVVRVVEKPRHPPTRQKGVGVYLFTPIIFDAVRRTPRTAMRDEYEITDSIQILVNDGYHVRTSCCVEGDINVTMPGDLLAINLEALRDAQTTVCCASTANVSPSVSLRECVVGEYARIGDGARLERCVVFPHADVSAHAEIRQAIITRDGVCSV